ncbi:putative membrane protein [Hypnocyclicus thermotrophus]|uniref:Membrane protein n=1 Tax=Hypnocyclicus thermotrophus TaxID=1627895 RepID=A0AA46DZR7_9FUSO|nr:YibE/F family protein [Hypnocyclicus thermotrophus]TDT71992.1 putative membrane protein [Hypnocyclicus thermotrophus]
MKKILLLMLIFISTLSFANDIKEEYLSAKIINILSKEKATQEDENVEYYLNLKIKILDKNYKNQIITLKYPIYKNKIYNLNIKKGSKIVLYKYTEDENQEYYIFSFNNNVAIIILISIFLTLVVLIAKKSGIKAIIALIISLLFVYKLLIPGILKGYSPIVLAVIFSTLSTVITIYLNNDNSIKKIVAIISTLLGVIFSGIISLIFVKYLNITGYSNTESYSYMYILGQVNLKEIVSAGIIIGALGAVMDIGVSISSALWELKEQNPEMNEKELINSGMNIGKDVIGTMVNTLILAYVGSSIFTILLIVAQNSKFPLIRVLNTEFILIELLRGLAGSIGIVIVVPIATFLSSKIYTRHFSKKMV